MPAFKADAVFQDHKVSAKGPQECVHILWGPLRIDLINLQNEVEMEQGVSGGGEGTFLGVMLRPDTQIPCGPGHSCPVSHSLE